MIYLAPDPTFLFWMMYPLFALPCNRYFELIIWQAINNLLLALSLTGRVLPLATAERKIEVTSSFMELGEQQLESIYHCLDSIKY